MDILHYGTLDSTNSEAKRLVAAGRAPGFAVQAETQTAGRGRFDRPWQTPPGNLAITLAIRPSAPVAEWPSLALLSGLAIHRVLRPIVGEDRSLAIKWPNDVLIDGAKVSGTLIESDGGVVYVGTGINVATSPQGVAYPTAALSEMGAVDVRELGRALVRSWLSWYAVWARDGFAPLVPAYRERQHRYGQEIRIALDREKRDWVTGLCRGVDGRGRLLLEGPDGTLSAHMAGDADAPAAMTGPG